MILFIIIMMIFMHIVDDFSLQGILATLKQKDWWQENTSHPRKNFYKYDFIPALIAHGFSWSVCIHIPIIVYSFYTYSSINYYALAISIFINMIIHVVIDHLKANEKCINLCMDQSMHICQILCTFEIWNLFWR